MKLVSFGLVGLLLMTACKAQKETSTVRIATFNVSMEASNYVAPKAEVTGNELHQQLSTADNAQIKNIAEIIQRVRPDILLLNEFDYLPSNQADIKHFTQHYLQQSQNGQAPIEYPYVYTNEVNTGIDSGLDLDKDGIASGSKGDAFGFGFFAGHYGMLVLSQYPIHIEQVRSFQRFLWKDMPNNLLSTIKQADGQDYYSSEAQNILRLSSKSHWDLPIQIGNQVLHLLASHPTPPVFDGPEDRNGKRNHDEIRFWHDYISGPDESSYIYDDQGKTGGLADSPFVIVGDLNASIHDGDAYKTGISALLAHKLVNNQVQPKSVGGKENRPENPNAATHTAAWGMRADYVLPSNDLTVKNAGVFWPSKTDALFRLVKDRSSSSDHRLVWVDITLAN
ncbi:endonuclease/exonuclease/phosphatase family protein [Paraglaciecola aestuariivivens]